jgi:DNA-directed RNA polymerase specialized sigma24 family protein
MRQASLADYEEDLSHLTVSERRVYRSVEYEGLRPAEYAEAHPTWSASTVRTLLHRARGAVEQ